MPHEWPTVLAGLVVPVIELMALVVIAGGTLEAFASGLRVMLTRPERPDAARAVWLCYSRWLVAGLTFQLAADIIATSTAPDWDDIGQLAAIAVIRTFLSFFLERDQRERQDMQRDAA